MVFTTKRDSVPEKGTTTIATHIRQSLQVVKHNRVLKLMLVGFCFWGFAFNAIELYWQPQLKGILGSDAKTWIFGIINSGYFAASLLGVVAINYIFSRRHRSYLLSIFVVRIVVGALIIILAFQRSVFSFSAAYLVMFFFNGMANIPESTVFNLEIPEDKRSSLLSISSLTVQLGGVAGSLLFSFLVSKTTISGIWIIAGALFAVSSVLYIFAHKGYKR